ncbi:hypothetical protein D3C81_1963690 [compost metagenome]
MGLELLEADDVGSGSLEPLQQDGKAPVHAVHVIGRDLHVIAPASHRGVAAQVAFLRGAG